MTAKFECSRCQVELDKVSFCEPNLPPNRYSEFKQRPPLCQACWAKRYAELTAEAK